MPILRAGLRFLGGITTMSEGNKKIEYNAKVWLYSVVICFELEASHCVGPVAIPCIL